jgi:hypothetical protein
MIMKKFFPLFTLGLMAAMSVTFGQVSGPTQPSSTAMPSHLVVSWAEWQSDADRRAFWLERGMTLTTPADAGAKAASQTTPIFATLSEAQGSVIPETERHTICQLYDGTVVTFWSLARMETLWQRHMKAVQIRWDAESTPQSITPASKKS